MSNIANIALTKIFDFSNVEYIGVPASVEEPYLYRLQPGNAEKPYYFNHSDGNRFSTPEQPCSYYAGDFRTAFLEKMHYMVKNAAYASERGAPIVITREVFESVGIIKFVPNKKIRLIDLTRVNSLNRFDLDFDPATDSDLYRVREFAQQAYSHSQSEKTEAMGFFYRTKNGGTQSIALWQEAVPMLEGAKVFRDNMWNVICPHKADIAKNYNLVIME